MPHNPIRVVVGPANSLFTSREVSITCTIFSLMNNFLARCDPRQTRHCCGANQTSASVWTSEGKAYFCFVVIAAESDVQQLAAESGDDRSVVIGARRRRTARHRESPRPPSRSRHLLPLRRSPPPAQLGHRSPSGMNDAGQALHYEIFDDANFMVLVEPEIILNAPQQYLLAGIGDTLAKMV